jgi:hypothetical protein
MKDCYKTKTPPINIEGVFVHGRNLQSRVTRVSSNRKGEANAMYCYTTRGERVASTFRCGRMRTLLRRILSRVSIVPNFFRLSS